VADLNIAQDTPNPAQQPQPAPDANKPQGEAPANATAAMASAHDVSDEKRADDGKWTSGGGGGAKKEEAKPDKKAQAEKESGHAFDASIAASKADKNGVGDQAQEQRYNAHRLAADAHKTASEWHKAAGSEPHDSEYHNKKEEFHNAEAEKIKRANQGGPASPLIDESSTKPSPAPSGGKADEMGEGADGKPKKVSEMSKGELKTHGMRKKLEALRAKNAEGAKKLADTNARVSELHSQLVEQLKSGTGTANDDLKKTVNELGAKIAETKMHTKTIQHALRGEDIASDEHGQDSPEHEAARKRTEYVAEKAK
jgi:hypothetical protein